MSIILILVNLSWHYYEIIIPPGCEPITGFVDGILLLGNFLIFINDITETDRIVNLTSV